MVAEPGALQAIQDEWTAARQVVKDNALNMQDANKGEVQEIFRGIDNMFAIQEKYFLHIETQFKDVGANCQHGETFP